MARGRKAKEASRSGRVAMYAGLAAFVILGAFLVLASRGHDDAPIRDIHGIAVDPDDSGVLYVATHNGLVRGEDGRWTAVGDAQDDLMGFSMHPTNGSTFYVSGHPRGGGNMGVRVSRDGGETWQQAGIEGVDFHAMTISPADPARLWGIARGQLYATTDAGATWSVTNPSAPQVAVLVADPMNATTLYATTGSAIIKSLDAGLTWSQLGGVAALGLAIDPQESRNMYAGGQGALWASVDGGASWAPLEEPGQGRFAYLAVDPNARQTIYAATYEASIHRSEDAGVTWTTLREP